MKFNPYSLLISSATLIVLFGQAFAVTYTVDTADDTNPFGGGVSTTATSGDLRFVLNTILNDQAQGTFAARDISFTGAGTSITLSDTLPMINLLHNDPTTINVVATTPVTINGAGNNRAFFVRQGTVSIQNMLITNTNALAGTGGDAGGGAGPGGGGLGAGGGLFVDSAATVNLTDVLFTSNIAHGGNSGGISGTDLTGGGGAGGGGLGGNGGYGGGKITSLPLNGGGGGGGGYSGNGGVGGVTTNVANVGSGGGGGFADGGDASLNNIGTSFNGGGGGGGGAILGADGGTGSDGTANATNGDTVSTFVVGGGGGGAGEDNTATFTNPGAGGGTTPGAAGPAGGGGGSGGFNGVAAISGTGGAGLTSGGGGGGGGGVIGAMNTNNGGAGGDGAGGGGGGLYTFSGSGNGGAGGYGGGGGGGVQGGLGGFGGGGGGAANASLETPGNGGFGGGGGGGVASSTNPGGSGGFGAGGAGGAVGDGVSTGLGGAGGIAGHDGLNGSGSGANFAGGGAGLGGAIFINNGGTVTYATSAGNLTTSGNDVIPGGVIGLNQGAAKGQEVFVRNGSTLTFQPVVSTTINLAGSIADDSLNSLPGPGYNPGSGAGSTLIMNGAGTLSLQSTANTYANGTNIQNGVLAAGGTSGTPLGSGTVTISATGTLQANANLTLSNPITVNTGSTFDTNGFTTTLNGAITGASTTIDVNNSSITPGLLVLNNASNNFGAVTLNSSIQLGVTGAFPSAGDLTMGPSAGTFDLNGFNATVGTIAGSDGIVNIPSSSVLTIEQSTLSFNSTIQGPGSITKTTAGTLTIGHGNLNYGGTTDIQAGTVSISDPKSLGTGTITIETSGTLQSTAAMTITNPIDAEGGKIDAKGVSFISRAPVTGVPGFEVIDSSGGGTGQYVLQNPSSTNTFGQATITSGTLFLQGASNPFPIGSNLTMNGGNLLMNTFNTTIGTISGTTGVLDLGASPVAILTIQQSSGSFNSTIQGMGNLVKTTAGTLTIGGANTFTGPTDIQAGILKVTSSGALSSGTVTIESAGTLQAGANVTLPNPIVVNTGSTIDVPNFSLDLTGQMTGPLLNVTGSGTGKVILDNNTNSFASASIASGTLQVGSVGGPGSFPVGNNLSMTGGTFDMNDQNTTIGAISGTTGTVNIGTVAGSILTIQQSTGTFSGVIQGSGSLAKTTSGTLTLGATNTYGNGTSIQGGVLSVSTGTSLGSGTITIGSAGTLQGTSTFTQTNAVSLNSGSIIDVTSGTVTMSGQFTGVGGSLTKTSAGALNMTNATNSYNGGTLISGGILGISGNVLGTGTVTISPAGTLQAFANATLSNTINVATGCVIDVPSTTLDLTGQVSGAIFSVIDSSLANTGVVTLDNATNSFTEVDVDSGTVKVGTVGGFPSGANLALLGGGFNMNDKNSTIGTVSGSTGNMTIGTNPASILTIQQSAGSFDVHITGKGGLTKTTSGQLTLGNSNTYLGLTTVNGGILSVNGSILHDVLVQSGGTLKGTGTIFGTVNVANGGTISPGNSIGTITVANLVLNPTSITNIEISPTATSQIIVTGTASLAGSVQVVADPGVYPSTITYTILTAPSAGAISGSYIPTVLGGISTLDLQVVQNGNLIQLITARITKAIPTSTLSGNNLTLANYLNTSPNINSDELQDLSFLPLSELTKALESVSPARNAFGVFVTQNLMFSLSEIVSSHMTDERFFQFAKHEALGNKNLQKNTAFVAAAEDMPKVHEDTKDNYNIWLGTFGDFAHENEAKQNPAFDFISEGAVVGFDYFIQNDGLVGAGIGYAHSHIHDEQDAGKANVNYYIGTLYGTKYFSDFYLETVLWGVFHKIHNERHIFYPGVGILSGVDTTAKASIYGWQLTPHLGFGYTIEKNWVGVEPFAAFDWAINWEREYEEQGAGVLNMRQNSHTSSMLRSEIGLRFFQSWIWENGSCLFREKLGYVNKKPFGTGRVSAAILGDPSFFTVEAFQSSENLLAVGFDFVIQPGKKAPLVSLTYGGEFGPSYTSNEVLIKISKSF